MSRYVIYGLFEPESGELRYIGRSSSGLKRARAHATPTSLKLDDHCHRWVKTLVEKGMRPEVDVLETWSGSGDANEWLNEAEIFWIAYWRSLGANLTNLTDGGYGTSGRKWTSEQTDVMRQKMIGKNVEKVRSQETRELIRKANLGKKMSSESIEKTRQAHLGSKRSDESKEKMRQAKLGTHRSEETKKIISENSGRKRSIRCIEDGQEFESIVMAAKFYEIHHQMIRNMLAGYKCVAGGKRFEYLNEKQKG